MGFVIGFLTFIMVVDCLLLILLVIVQLPKKEAGAGIAFGGGTADALFGAGSGNALTKITKYAIGVLFGLALLISVLQKRGHTSNFMQEVENPSRPTATSSSATQPPTAAANSTATTNLTLEIPPAANGGASAPTGQ